MSKKTLYWVFLVVFVVSGVGAQAHFSPFFEGKNRGVVQAFLPTSVAKVKDLFFSDAKTFVVRVTYQTNIDAQVAQLKGETAFSLSEKKLDTFAKEVLSSHLDKEILSAVNILTMEELRKQQPSYAHVTSKKVDPNIIYVSLKVTYMQQINSSSPAGNDFVIGAVQPDIWKALPECRAEQWIIERCGYAGRYSYAQEIFHPKVFAYREGSPFSSGIDAAISEAVSDVAVVINQAW